ncbi:MAG TPA: VOC family protein [Chthoniobacterales bacterium]
MLASCGGIRKMQEPMFPRIINHIGLTVENLEEAVAWYQKVLGFQVLMGPLDVTVDDSPLGILLRDFFDPRLKRLRMCHLTTGNGVGFEIFEFIEPKSQRPATDFEYTRGGFYHICVTDPDIEGLIARIVENGGRQRGHTCKPYAGAGYQAAYCHDPFGNVIEVLSHSWEQLQSNRDRGRS